MLHFRLLYEVLHERAQFVNGLHRVVDQTRHIVVQFYKVASEVHKSEVNEILLYLDTDEESRVGVESVEYRSASFSCFLLSVFVYVAHILQLAHCFGDGRDAEVYFFRKFLDGGITVGYEIFQDFLFKANILLVAVKVKSVEHKVYSPIIYKGITSVSLFYAKLLKFALSYKFCG